MAKIFRFQLTSCMKIEFLSSVSSKISFSPFACKVFRSLSQIEFLYKVTLGHNKVKFNFHPSLPYARLTQYSKARKCRRRRIISDQITQGKSFEDSHQTEQRLFGEKKDCRIYGWWRLMEFGLLWDFRWGVVIWRRSLGAISSQSDFPMRKFLSP